LLLVIRRTPRNLRLLVIRQMLRKLHPFLLAPRSSRPRVLIRHREPRHRWLRP